jgi:uncharacterized membrane-anchored protein
MRFHDQRERLLAEVHARPATPVTPPMLATRISALSGQDGADGDRAHMAALCRRFGQPEPSPTMRWSSLEAGRWQLRWERHSEFSSWTAFRKPGDNPAETAMEDVPRDWIDGIPGTVLAYTTLRLTDARRAGAGAARDGAIIGSELMGGSARIYTDLHTDADGMTRYDVEVTRADPQLTGRLTLMLLEIETYRLMALLAFPLAGEAAVRLRTLEAEAGSLAARLSENLGIDDDRALLTRLVSLSGETEALNARTSFRFAAAAAYHDILLNRIAGLHEAPLPGFQTLGEFMERRLGPAMKTCESVAQRETAVIERIARAGEMLDTRVELVTQKINADLLASMNKRAEAQLRLQQTVEGLSVVAMAYYALSLLGYPLAAVAANLPGFDAKVASGVLALPVLAAAWWVLRRARGAADG